MIKTELEMAIRVTVDLSRPVSLHERDMVERSLILAKDLSALRGVNDPSIGVIERHLKALPMETVAQSQIDYPQDDGLSPSQEAERTQIVDVLKRSASVSEAARRLSIHRNTLADRITFFRISHPFGQGLIKGTAHGRV